MDYSTNRREEVANSLTHGLGFFCALAATPILITETVRHGGPGNIVGASIFAATVMMLYLASTLYHAAPGGPMKERLRKIDHAAIYLLIAGSYTPFTLGALKGAWGWTMFGLIWCAAAVGVGIKLISGVRYPKVSTALYLAMGWVMVIFIRPMIDSVPLPGLLWLLAGGLSYTVGVVFYAAPRLPYSHAIWHLFVITGSTCHYVAVWRYAA